MEFQVEREIDGRWYSMGASVEADSASRGGAICAITEGAYRVRLAEMPEAAPEYFDVPSWGPPVPLTNY